jgi:hypothetical protein
MKGCVETILGDLANKVAAIYARVKRSQSLCGTQILRGSCHLILFEIVENSGCEGECREFRFQFVIFNVERGCTK